MRVANMRTLDSHTSTFLGYLADRFFVLTAVMLVALSLSACRSAAIGESADRPRSPFNVSEEFIQKGKIYEAYLTYVAAEKGEKVLRLSSLSDGAVSASRVETLLYLSRVRTDELSKLYTGKGLTTALLLPYSDSVNRIILDGFGGEKPLRLSSNLFYRSNGLLGALVDGVPLRDTTSLAGIETLFKAELPWSPAKLASSSAFFKELTDPVSTSVFARFESLAGDLGTIAGLLMQASEWVGTNVYLFPDFLKPTEARWYRIEREDLFLLMSAVFGVEAVVRVVASLKDNWSLKELHDHSFDYVTYDAQVSAGNEVDWRDFVSLDFLSKHLGQQGVAREQLVHAKELVRMMLNNLLEYFTVVHKAAEKIASGRTRFSIDRVKTLISALKMSLDKPVDVAAVLDDSDTTTSIYLGALFDPTFYTRAPGGEWFKSVPPGTEGCSEKGTFLLGNKCWGLTSSDSLNKLKMVFPTLADAQLVLPDLLERTGLPELFRLAKKTSNDQKESIFRLFSER